MAINHTAPLLDAYSLINNDSFEIYYLEVDIYSIYI